MCGCSGWCECEWFLRFGFDLFITLEILHIGFGLFGILDCWRIYDTVFQGLGFKLEISLAAMAVDDVVCSRW